MIINSGIIGEVGNIIKVVLIRNIKFHMDLKGQRGKKVFNQI